VAVTEIAVILYCLGDSKKKQLIHAQFYFLFCFLKFTIITVTTVAGDGTQDSKRALQHSAILPVPDTIFKKYFQSAAGFGRPPVY
jgi:hypothetical protein